MQDKVKLGHDVLSHEPTEPPMKFYAGKKGLHPKILGILKESERPLSIQEIQKLAGIRSWTTSKAVLMDLVLRGEIEGFRSGHSFLFRVKKQT